MADSSRKTRSSGEDRPRSLVVRAFLIALLVGWAFVAASLVGFDRADPPGHMVWPGNSPVANWCGPFGAQISYGLLYFAGAGAWACILFVGLGLFSAAAGQWPRHAAVRLVGLLMLTASVAGFQNLVFPKSGPFADMAGGMLGVVGVNELSQRFGVMGSFLWLALLGLIGAIVAMDEWLNAAFGWSWRWARETGGPAAAVAGKATGQFAGEAALVAGKATAKAGGGVLSALVAMLRGTKPVQVRVNDLDDDSEMLDREKARAAKPRRRIKLEAMRSQDASAGVQVAEPGTELNAKLGAELDAKLGAGASDLIEPKHSRRAKSKVQSNEEHGETSGADSPRVSRETTSDDEDHNAGLDDAATPGAPQVFDPEALKAKIAKLPIALGQMNKRVATEADLRGLQNASEPEPPADPNTPPKVYQFPSLDLLENPEENYDAKLEEYVRAQAEALESALREYRLDGEVVGIESGPVITMYDVRLAPGTKVAALTAIASDIARALKAMNIRIVPNMAGRDTIGIEVPNAQKEKVRLKELMSKSEKFANMKLPMFLGKDSAGEPLIADLTQMPHALIAGTTGSGKSVCINTIIMSFLYTKKPGELKLVLVDPKMVEMSQFKDIPHLMCPVVTEMTKAAAILEWACGKMDERYELLAEAGCRDIASYNDLPWEELKERFRPGTPEEEARIPRKLPYMVFVIDELADLMMTAKEVESYIIRIAQKARAVGIHLILATQRPQANVVTGLIKSNMPCRISFKVASGMDSRIVLDSKGGELLLGHGDMLYLSPRSSKLTRAQGTLVDDQEIRRVVRFMRDVAGPSFERQLMAIRTTGAEPSDEERILQSENNSSASLAAAQEDPMFLRAVDIVLETKRGSVSLLQRRLAIGYTRASRLIDLMGIAGIISDHKGSVARDVLISPEEWDAMKKLAAEAGVGTTGPQPQLFSEEASDADGQAVASGPGRATSPSTIDQRDVDEPPFDTDEQAAIEAESDEAGDLESFEGEDDSAEDEESPRRR